MEIAHLTPLENAVIGAIVNGQSDSEQCLREQLRCSQLRSREFNGYGFYTNIAVSEDVPGCPGLSRTLHASALVDNQSCGFILWINAGRIDCLEGYPLGGDAWPEGQDFRDIILNKA